MVRIYKSAITMTNTDRWKTLTDKQRKTKEALEAFVDKHRPKVMEERIEGGVVIRVYEGR